MKYDDETGDSMTWKMRTEHDCQWALVMLMLMAMVTLGKKGGRGGGEEERDLSWHKGTDWLRLLPSWSTPKGKEQLAGFKS